jgi:hypothetical protein
MNEEGAKGYLYIRYSTERESMVLDVRFKGITNINMV